MSRIFTSVVLLSSGLLSVSEAQFRALKRLRDCHATLMAENALVGSRLGYCNSLFRSLSALDLRKLQCVQTSLARILRHH